MNLFYVTQTTIMSDQFRREIKLLFSHFVSPAVKYPDGQRRAVHFLLRKLQVKILHHRGEVGVLLCIEDHGALDDVSATLYIHSWMIDG